MSSFTREYGVLHSLHDGLLWSIKSDGQQLTALQLFHSLAAPILYRTMVLPNLPILLRKLDAFGNLAERPRSLKTAPLEALLAQTQTLRIAGLPPPLRPKVRLEHLLRHGSGGWIEIGATAEKTLEAARSAAYMELEALIEISHDPKQQDITIFPKVQQIILGQRSFWSWNSVGPIPATQLKPLDAWSSAFDRFISAHAPKSICTHSDQGPYSLLGASLIGPRFAKLQPIVTRHVYEIYQEAPIIPGAKNRWIYYPGCTLSESNITLDGHGGPPGYSTCEELCKSIGQAVFGLHCRTEGLPTLVGRTSLEIYGPATTGWTIRERLYQATHGLDEASPIHQAARSTDPEIYAQVLANIRGVRKELLAGELQYNNTLEAALHQYAYLPEGEASTKLVKLLLWQDTPPCDCCGWKMDDYMEEFTAGLGPREAVLMRALMEP